MTPGHPGPTVARRLGPVRWLPVGTRSGAGALVLGLVGVLPLAACGAGDEGARTPLTPVQPTAYVTIDAPTTTTSTVPPPPPTAPGGAVVVTEEQVYTVQAGDNLYRIAERFGITLDELLAHNTITVDLMLTPGQTQLRIPGGAVAVDGAEVQPGTATGASTPPPGTTAAPGAGCVHVVVAGDFQGKVAQQYGVSLDQLAAANAGNPAWNVFRLGDEIIIPAGGSC